MKVEDAVLSLDNFNTPKIVRGLDAVNLKIMRLILFEPGTDPDQPDKGIGLVSKFRYMGSNNLLEFRDRISNQITTYLPEFTGVDVQVEIYKEVLHIGIIVDKVLYEFSYDGERINNQSLNALKNLM